MASLGTRSRNAAFQPVERLMARARDAGVTLSRERTGRGDNEGNYVTFAEASAALPTGRRTQRSRRVRAPGCRPVLVGGGTISRFGRV